MLRGRRSKPDGGVLFARLPRGGFAARAVWFFLPSCFMCCPRVLAFELASAICYLASRVAVRCVCLCAGFRVLLSSFTRRPCAGRHLLFFAAAKKSRQKKAAHTANFSSCLRDPNRSLTSRGNFSIQVRCQRYCGAPHPLRAPASPHAALDNLRPPRWQTVRRP